MVKRIKLKSAEDLRQFMNIAWQWQDDVGVHTPDGQIADAKSIIGLMALDYEKDVMVVTENEKFFELIEPWIVEEDK